MRLFGPTHLCLLLAITLVCVTLSWLCRRRQTPVRAVRLAAGWGIVVNGRTTCWPAAWSRSVCSGCCGCPYVRGRRPRLSAKFRPATSSSFQVLPANLTLILCAAAAAFGQSADAPAPIPAFEVASVKAGQPGQPGEPGRGGGRGRRDNIQVSPGTVTMRNVSLKASIRWAWHVSEFQVSGPDWLDSERYEIAGKAAGPATEEQLRLMMQTLLRERFKLALHRQTKELSAYVLVAGKNGPKVQEAKTQGEASIEVNQRQLSVSVQRAPLSQLVEMLANVLRAPVIDMTGLTGRYDVTLNVAKYVGDMAARGQSIESAAADPQALISMILQDEFGLKLEARKMPLDLVIVDHAEKVPVEN